MSSYRLVLNNQKLGFYDRFAIFILLMTVVASAILYSMRTVHTTGHIAAIITLAASFGSIVAFTGRRQRIDKVYLFVIPMLIAAVTWLISGYWWAAVLSLFLAFLYFRSRQPLIVSVGASGVHYPSFPEKHIRWDRLSNVVLKDGLLTIDFRNNHIIQQELDENMDTPNAADFNEFCRRQLQGGNVPA